MSPVSSLSLKPRHQGENESEMTEGTISTAAIFDRLRRKLETLVNDDDFWQQKEAALAQQAAMDSAESARLKAERKQRQLQALPSRYRTPFDPKLAQYPAEIVQKVRQWQPGAEGIGIGLAGSTGLGKTRLLTARLRQLDCTWLYLPAARLNDLVVALWSDDRRTADEAQDMLSKARRVRVLMLDDIGDERTTEAVSEELKDLIETRTADRLPILWTSNLSERELSTRHGSRGAAIVRRLAEYSWMP